MLASLTTQPLFGIGLTLLVFVLAQRIYLKSDKNVLLTPVAVSIAVIIVILLLGDISYDSYFIGGQYIHFLLGPSVVVLAVPLYRRRREIYDKRVPILAGVTVGAFVSIISACGLTWILGGSREVVLSMAPKSVTTPIAIGLAEKIGGIPELTAVIVILTGCIGAVCGPEFCRLVGITSPSATGLAVGTAAHGIGTARMLEVDHFVGAVSGLAIGLNGLVTAILLPALFVMFF